MKMNINFLLIALLGAVTRCVAYPTGAPVDTCSTLLPQHTGAEPQQGSAPYTVTAEKIGPNKVRVTISSPHGQTFKGFLLQARSADDGNKFIAGEFTSDAISKGLKCNGLEQSALTHVNADPKTQVTTEWTGTANVIFRATVVKSLKEYWTNIDSEAVRTDETDISEYHGCFESKGCIGLPPTCVNDSACAIFFTYQVKDDGSFLFALHGLLNVSEYMAVGFSDDNVMGNDFVHECVRFGSEDIKQRTSWNVGKNNSRTEDFSGTYDNKFVDGLTTCTWTQPKDIDFPGKVNNKTYILLAFGPVHDDGELTYHFTRSTTEEPVDLFAYRLSDRKVHGKKGSTKQPGKTTIMKAPSNGCSQLNFGLFWLAFLAVFYAGGRNALNLV